MPTQKLAKTKRAAGYIRVSTAAQATDGLSLEAQEDRIRERIAAKGWELADIYADKGVSGRKTDRPELDRMLSTLGEIDCVIVWRLDRLGRNTRHLLETYDRLEAAAVDLVSLSDDIDTSTPMGKAMRVIMSALAELESATTGERVRAVMSGRTSDKGLHHGSAPPFGYEKPAKQLLPVEPQAGIVRRIFQEYAAGRSQGQICAALNGDKITSPGKKPVWIPSTISRITGRVTYAGKLEMNGEVFEGQHAPIIDAGLWEKVQSLRCANKHVRGKGKGRKPATHLFIQGHLRCALCSGIMLPRTDTRSGREYYMCSTRSELGKEACAMRNVPRLPVDQAVFDYFSDVGIDLDATRERLLTTLTAKQNETKQLLRAAQKAERGAAAAIERVKDDYAAGKIEAEDWKELRNDLRARQREASERAQALEAELASADGESEAVASAGDSALERLAEVRAAVAGEISNPADIEAARAGLQRMFEAFLIAPITDSPPVERPAVLAEIEAAQAAELDDVDLVEAGEWLICPEPREELVEDLGEISLRPVLDKEILPANQYVNNRAGRTLALWKCSRRRTPPTRPRLSTTASDVRPARPFK
jgi:site-specific DNA recombinase